MHSSKSRQHLVQVQAAYGGDPWQVSAAGMKENWALWGLECYTHLCKNICTPSLLYVSSYPSTGHDFSLHLMNEEPVVQMVKEPAQDGPACEGGK